MKSYKSWIFWGLVLSVIAYVVYVDQKDRAFKERIHSFGTLQIGRGDEVTAEQVNLVGNALVSRKDFTNYSGLILFRKINRRYVLQISVRPGAENLDLSRWFREIGESVSQVLQNSPVDILLCDDDYKPIRGIPFEPIRPTLPVTITFRRTVGGGGLVAQFSNASDKFLTLKLKLSNPTLGERKETTIKIKPKSMNEHGWLEGWDYQSGETIILEHADFESVQVKVP